MRQNRPKFRVLYAKKFVKSTTPLVLAVMTYMSYGHMQRKLLKTLVQWKHRCFKFLWVLGICVHTFEVDDVEGSFHCCDGNNFGGNCAGQEYIDKTNIFFFTKKVNKFFDQHFRWKGKVQNIKKADVIWEINRHNFLVFVQVSFYSLAMFVIVHHHLDIVHHQIIITFS